MTVEQLKEAIVCRVQHELRTPLTIASMAYELLASGEADGSTAEQCRELLGRALRTLEGHLLTFSRLSAGSAGLEARPKPVDLVALARTALARVRGLAEARGVALVLEARGGPRPFPADATLLAEALERLIENAVRFNRPGGLARVAVRFGGRRASLTVSDDGPGIATSDLTLALRGFHQAEEFLTRREGGLGAGVAVSRAIAEAHGGRLRASSRLGKGSVFTIILPEVPHDPEDPDSR